MPPDENALRRLRDAALANRCPFERALLARCAACSLARPVLVAEREVFGCVSAAASVRCGEYRQRLREAARFALRIDGDSPLPFGKVIRLQCGGLIGLAEAIGTRDADDVGDAPRAAAVVADADGLLRDALDLHGGLDGLPWSRIIRAVVRYQPRRAARR
jgi:hypothetical protein